MSTSGGIVIVGGGLAAARTAEQLRRSEYAGPVTIVSDEEHLPYDRPPLSKEVLRAETDDVTLKPAEFYTENDITVLLGNAVRTIDVAAQTVKLANGGEVAYDDVIIATGLVPRRIPSFPDLDGIHVLRSFDECLKLREEAGSARRAVIVGAGFIGCEVAASLRGLGVDVVLVEPQPTPLASVLGEQIGELVARLHRAEGVDVRCGIGVAEVAGAGPPATSDSGAGPPATSDSGAGPPATSDSGAGPPATSDSGAGPPATSDSGHQRVRRVVLSDGTELDADLVVVGIGSRPATDWLEGTGVEVDNGIVCDEAGRTSAPHVWAIGDVASWRHTLGHQVRVEHWSNVADQARALVPALLGQDASGAASVPYFWSDQYDVKIQCLGEPEATDIVHIVEDDGRKFLAYYERDGVVAGVVGGGMPGKVMKTRSKIASGAPIADVLG